MRDSPSDDLVGTSPGSPNHAETRVVLSNATESELQETVKSLTEKLSAALLSISAKEDLVKQHSKVAEEAVSGWEKAETEVAVLKQQLEDTSQKNSAFEDKISHLDGALKECVRQLRQLRDEQEQKIHDAIAKNTQELVSNQSELENQLIALKAKLEASKAEINAILADSRSKLEAIENENASLKAKLLVQSEELEIRTLERELSTQAAETASKQHLESIKKAAKLEAECRKLRALTRKTSPLNDHKTISSTTCVESLTDSQSDNGDRLLGVDNELSGSDSWASALIAELDQFKNEKSGTKVRASSVNIDLMDDFLEMERLAAMPEADHGSSPFGFESDSCIMASKDSPSKGEDEALNEKIVELQAKVEKLEIENTKLEMALAENQSKLEVSCNQLTIAEGKLVQLQQELELANESKLVSDAKTMVLESQIESTLEGKAEVSEMRTKLEALEATREAVESQLHLACVEVENLRKEIGLLERKIEEEKSLSACLAAKLDTAETARKVMEYELDLAPSNVRNISSCKNLDADLLRKRQEAECQAMSCSNGDLTLNQEKELAVAAEKLAECQKTIASLGRQLKSLTTLDPFTLEAEKRELNGGSPSPSDPLGDAGSATRPNNGKERGSPPSAASSVSIISGVGKLLSRRSSNCIDDQ